MKLCYRGVSYERKPTQIEISQTTDTVKFRGSSYELNSYELNDIVLSLKDGNQEDIVYRGVSSSQNKQTRFLGQVCLKKAIAIAVKAKQTRFLGQLSGNNSAPVIANSNGNNFATSAIANSNV